VPPNLEKREEPREKDMPVGGESTKTLSMVVLVGGGMHGEYIKRNGCSEHPSRFNDLINHFLHDV